MTPFETFRHVVLVPALQRIWPALSSQIVIVMLGSAVVSQIAVEDLTFAANFIQSRNFRAFETYIVSTLIYLVLAIAAAADPARRRLACSSRGGRRDDRVHHSGTSCATCCSRRAGPSCCRSSPSSAAASSALLLLFAGSASAAAPRMLAVGYIELFQGTPLLMQLFLAFFGLGLVGIDVPAWLAAGIGADPVDRRLPRRDLARLRRSRSPRASGKPRPASAWAACSRCATSSCRRR